MHYDEDPEDHLLPYRPPYPWREIGTFTVSMVILIWILWSFARYVWSYFFG
jgi:hypothetical protein